MGFISSAEKLMSNIPVQKNKLYQKASAIFKNSEDYIAKGEKVALSKGIKESAKIGELSDEATALYQLRLDDIIRKYGVKSNDELDKLSTAHKRTFMNIASSKDDIGDLTKDAIEQMVSNTQASQNFSGRIQSVKDWFADPVRTLKNETDPAMRKLAQQQMAGRYGAVAGGTVLAGGVMHDMVSSDENDNGLLNVPIAGASGAAVGGIAYGVSKLLKV